MIVLFIVVMVLSVLLVGALIAFAVSRLDKAVQSTSAAVEKKQKGYNPAATLGHKISPQSNTETQLKEARLLAAQQAAATPRGKNMRIGQLREQTGKQPTAFDGVKEDPLTAVKIANVHGWDAVRTGITATAPAPAAAKGAPAAKAAPVAKAAPAVPEPQLIEITDSMSPEEVRKARIANSKAQSAYKKALKAAGVEDGDAAAPVVAAPEATAVAAAPAVDAAALAGIAKPDLIEITDSMSPEEIRKARIANSKAQSAYNKALKEAGISPAATAVPAAPVAAAAPAEPAPAPAAPAVDAAALAGIPKPTLIEITDDMSPEAVRQARVANAKANSAYKKALKEAGIDPATVE